MPCCSYYSNKDRTGREKTPQNTGAVSTAAGEGCGQGTSVARLIWHAAPCCRALPRRARPARPRPSPAETTCCLVPALGRPPSAVNLLTSTTKPDAEDPTLRFCFRVVSPDREYTLQARAVCAVPGALCPSCCAWRAEPGLGLGVLVPPCLTVCLRPRPSLQAENELEQREWVEAIQARGTAA